MLGLWEASGDLATTRGNISKQERVLARELDSERNSHKLGTPCSGARASIVQALMGLAKSNVETEQLAHMYTDPAI